ncbi:MAG: hypothetical protein ACT4PT_06200 [Methanobacteriota archaeon]
MASLRPETAPCKHCGNVFLVASMVRLGKEGEYEYACMGCARKGPA